MEWARYIDGYCERLGPGLWAEPLNAATNAAFLIAAIVMWYRIRGHRLPLAGLLVVILAAIGIGSLLFHTYATVWASVADIVPIAAFILTYLLAANLHFWNVPRWAAALGMLAFVPYAIVTAMVFDQLPFLAISAVYWPVPLLIALTAWLLWARQPVTARGLVIGALLLSVSIVLRSLDARLCGVVPLGTHFLWHILNATMLAWMIEVYRRHMLAGARAGR